MKLNCTTGPQIVAGSTNDTSFPPAKLRAVVTDGRASYDVALFVSDPSGIGDRERDANAHLFSMAAEMLQILIDQDALLGPVVSYDDGMAACLELSNRRTAILARLKAAGVISEGGF